MNENTPRKREREKKRDMLHTIRSIHIHKAHTNLFFVLSFDYKRARVSHLSLIQNIFYDASIYVYNTYMYLMMIIIYIYTPHKHTYTSYFISSFLFLFYISRFNIYSRFFIYFDLMRRSTRSCSLENKIKL